MVETTRGGDPDARIMLSLLNSVERDGAQSQRRLASELGISLGLVNAYLRRCIKKGLVKSRQVPARRFVYYLTPHGFAEKAGLVVRYLSSSFEFFREAKQDCARLLEQARAEGRARIVLIGKSDLAEIVALCALECNVRIVAVVDEAATESRFLGVPLLARLECLDEVPDALMVTDLQRPQTVCAFAVARFGVDRVLIPSLLQVNLAAVAVNAP